MYLNFSNSTFPKQLHVYEQSGLPFSPVLHLWMFSRFFICHVIFCSPQIFPLHENMWQCTTKFTGMLCKTLFIDIMNYIRSLKTHAHIIELVLIVLSHFALEMEQSESVKKYHYFFKNSILFPLDLPPHFTHRILKTRKSAKCVKV